MNSKSESNHAFSNEIKKMFNRKGKIILLSVILLTTIYWILAKWYTNKSGYSKDLVVFYALFQPIFGNTPWLDYWQYIYIEQNSVQILLGMSSQTLRVG